MKFDPNRMYEKILLSADERIHTDVNQPILNEIYYGDYQGEFITRNYVKTDAPEMLKNVKTDTYSGVFTVVPTTGFDFFVDAKLMEFADLRKYVFATTVTNRFGVFVLVQILGDKRPYLLLGKAAENFFRSSVSIIYKSSNKEKANSIRFELSMFEQLNERSKQIFELVNSRTQLMFSNNELCLMQELYKRYKKNPTKFSKQERIYSEYSNTLEFLITNLAIYCSEDLDGLSQFVESIDGSFDKNTFSESNKLIAILEEFTSEKSIPTFIEKLFQLNSEVLFREFYIGDGSFCTIVEKDAHPFRELGVVILRSSLETLIMSPENTGYGQYFPVVSLRVGAILKKIDLLDSNSEKSELFWRYTPQHTYFLNEVISNEDYPIPISDITAYFKNYFDEGASTSQLIEQREKLFEEACSLQCGHIPPNAFVVLEVGPFSGVYIIERKEEIVFKWAMHDGGVYISYLNKLTAGVGVETTSLHFGVNELAAERITDERRLEEQVALWEFIDANLIFIAVCIVRDFWVYEEKERDYSEISATQLPKDLRKKAPKSLRVVYLPRKRYSQGRPASKAGEALDIDVRARHIVRQHFRKVAPSLKQRYLAQSMNIELPDGHTLITSHFRGDPDAQTVYKSRSALMALCDGYNKSAIRYNNKHSWFQFEQDVKKLHERNGYTILHQATSGIGDGGVDIVAQRVDCGESETLIIQCKKWRQVVGPSIVRELIGAVEDFRLTHSIDAKGLLYTTSYFSTEAIELAARHNVILRAGDEWMHGI